MPLRLVTKKMSNSRKFQIFNCLATYFQKRHWIGISLRTILVLVCGTGVVSVGQAQSDPSVVGQWSPLMTWPFKSVHTVYFPTTGKVFFWPSFEMGDNPILYDPVSGATAPTTHAGYNFFCAGLSLLPDGRLFVTGGDLVTGSGVPNASIYDPVTAAWTFLPAMNEARWYPTNTTLGNGDVLVTSGTVNPTVGNNPLPQIFQLTSQSWRDLSMALLVQPTYPEMYLLPDGNVFNPGPDPQSRFLNTTGTGAWTLGPISNFGYRDYGPAVMYDTNKFLLAGGGNPPTSTAETIDLSVQNPTFQYVSPMTYPRRQSNATILADGTVLVTGGSCGPGFDNAACPVYPAELWNPSTGTWTVMASLSIYRGYHATTILMPDGSVLSGGGNFSSAEIYYPPYFFAGPRPTITSAPATVDPGATFFVATPDYANITSVNLIRLSATTHTNNMEQRISHLSFTQDAANGGLQLTAPATNNIVPPGYYMLFILKSGVPSLASLVQITNAVQAGTPAIALSTKFLSFGGKTAGTLTTLPVTLKNLSNATLNINSVQVQGSAFSLGTNTCTNTLGPQASCTIKASFQPPASGPFQGSLILSDSDINSPQVVTLSGRGSALQLSSLALSFGTVAVGGSSATPQKLTLTNLGASPLSLTGFAYSNAQFSQNAAGTTCGGSLAGGASCVLASVFSPLSNGFQSGNLTISSSDPGSPTVVNLSGTGGALTFSGGMGFGSAPLTFTSPTLTTTLSNLSGSDYNVSFTLGGSNPGDFAIVSNPCGTVVAAGTNCVITAKFAPLALGARSAVLTAAYSQVGGEGGDSNSGTTIANMTGTGTPNVVSLAVTPANPAIGFGATQQFAAIATYSDASTKDLTPSVNWASLTTTVATMSATTKGLATAVGAGSSVIKINYLGIFGQTGLTVTGAAANLNPDIAFGNQALLSTSAPMSTTLSNTGIAAINITNVGLGGANAGDFAIQSNLCGAQLQPNANCTISVTFSPQALGTRAATLVVTDNSGAGTQSINLTGTGTPNLTSIAVTPANPSIQAGSTQQFIATGTYSDSSTKDLTASATWMSASTSVATMSTTVPGLANGIASGTSSISAASAGITGSTILTVAGTPGQP